MAVMRGRRRRRRKTLMLITRTLKTMKKNLPHLGF
jgi:hypothetical protein